MSYFVFLKHKTTLYAALNRVVNQEGTRRFGDRHQLRENARDIELTTQNLDDNDNPLLRRGG
jgi:hypothetical protein